MGIKKKAWALMTQRLVFCMLLFCILSHAQADLKDQSMAYHSVLAHILQRAQAEHRAQAQIHNNNMLQQFNQSQSHVSNQTRINRAQQVVSNPYPGYLGQASQDAFAKVVRNTNPLTPEQIQALHQVLDQSKRAVSKTPGIPPKPISSSVMVHLTPGSTPPVVRLRNGYVSAVMFLDATGQPWPIQAYVLGDSSLFNIHWDRKGNILFIQARSSYQQGNLAVRLRGLDIPIMLTLIPGQSTFDNALYMRIPRMGPNALPGSSEDLPATADPRLLGVLDGIPIDGATRLSVSEPGSSAWLQGNVMFLRTPLTLLSPGFESVLSASGEHAMHAYKLTPAASVLVMKHGKIKTLLIKGF